jgi:Transposase IS66 family/Transposase C of IS166 homeodomain
LQVTSTQGLPYYQTLNKPALIELIQQRDSELLACRQDVIKMTEECKRVQRILNLRNKKLFGSSSEKSSRLGLQVNKSTAIEEIEFEEVTPVQGDQAATGSTGEKPASNKRYAKPHPGRYALPEELPRVERHLYPEGYDSSWNREFPEERTERLSLKMELFVDVLVRHKFARELDAIAIAPYPINDPFFRHKFTTELVAGMFVMHAGMHLTHYQFHQQFLARYGISYTSVIDNMRKAHTLLEPLAACLHQEILQGAVQLCMDETRFSLLDTPANIAAVRASLDAEAIELGLEPPAATRKTTGKKAKTGNRDDQDDDEEELSPDMSKGKVLIKGQMWILYNPAAKLVLFAFSPTRATVNAVKLLGNFKGLLMADAYTVYRRIARLTGIDLILLTCWAHARRRFLESYDHAHPDPVVREVLIRIGELYKIEKDIKDRSPEDKWHARKQSILILQSLKVYLLAQLPQYAPKEAVAQAIQYTLNQWEALSAYPHHKGALIDNNEAERAIRPITISRKTSLFLGSVEQARGASLGYSLMECCRLHGVNQIEYMNDVLKIIETYPKEKLPELLPHNWKKIRGNNKAPS